MTAAAASMNAAAEARSRLDVLREAFAHSAGFQDWIAEWWGKLPVEERRIVLAFAGQDDSEAAARRPWKQHAPPARDLIVRECKRFARIVQPLKWA